MIRPSLIVIVVAAAATLVATIWFFGFRRAPACQGASLFMSTIPQCRAYGVDAARCAAAVEQARAVSVRAGPKADTSFDCELRHAECFAGPDGRYSPTPSFCLAPGASAPSDIRYLEYDSDRLGRKKLREVPIQ